MAEAVTVERGVFVAVPAGGGETVAVGVNVDVGMGLAAGVAVATGVGDGASTTAAAVAFDAVGDDHGVVAAANWVTAVASGVSSPPGDNRLHPASSNSINMDACQGHRGFAAACLE